jgi:tetratricopeptide (TPR) repeat protein
MLLGVLEETRGNWQKGQELYERALQVAPDYPQAANNLANSMLDHGGDVDVAFGLAQTARRGMPNSAAAADTLAWAYYQKSAYSTAIELLNEALAKSPNNSTYHYHIGMAYEKNKDQRRAIEHLQRALSINPNYAKANEIRQTLAALGTS